MLAAVSDAGVAGVLAAGAAAVVVLAVVAAAAAGAASFGCSASMMALFSARLAASSFILSKMPCENAGTTPPMMTSEATNPEMNLRLNIFVPPKNIFA